MVQGGVLRSPATLGLRGLLGLRHPERPSAGQSDRRRGKSGQLPGRRGLCGHAVGQFFDDPELSHRCGNVHGQRLLVRHVRPERQRLRMERPHGRGRHGPGASWRMVQHRRPVLAVVVGPPRVCGDHRPQQHRIPAREHRRRAGAGSGAAARRSGRRRLARGIPAAARPARAVAARAQVEGSGTATTPDHARP